MAQLSGCNLSGCDIFTSYNRDNGSVAPILGAASASTWPPTNWTSVQNASADDAFATISLPYNFTISGTSYNTVYIGSNFYITFGSGSTLYGQTPPGPLSASVPALDKFHIGAGDRSYQRVAYIQFGNAFVIRVEGAVGTSGVPGSSTIIYEATFINPQFYPTKSAVMALRMGNAGNTGSTLFGVYSSSTAYATTTLAENTSYVFEASNTVGTAWTIYTGQYILVP